MRMLHPRERQVACGIQRNLCAHNDVVRGAVTKKAQKEEVTKSPSLKMRKDDFLKFLEREARNRGLPFHSEESLFQNRLRVVRKNLVRIGGHLCRIFQPSSTKVGRTGALFTRPGISRSALEEATFIIVFQEADGRAPNLFIVPSQVLKESFHAGEVLHRFYIPHEPAYKTATLNWFNYKDAWCLLQPTRRASAVG